MHKKSQKSTNSAFKKKQNDSIIQTSSKLNSLLGLGSSFYLPKSEQVKQSKIKKEDIMSSAMFWDSKQRIDRVKSLILPNRNLKEFEDGEDFALQQLKSIELLSLAKNQIIHLQPLSILETLVCLNINNNKVYDLSPIQSLSNLEQLYANNNVISDIQFFGKGIHIKLTRIELYNNKISSLRDTIKAVEGLIGLKQLDIQENPVWNEETKKYLMQTHITRLNGQLISQAAKEKIIANSSIMSMSASGFYKTTQSVGTISIASMNNKAQLIKKHDQLQMKYLELDDQFENQIEKNVRLKGQLQNLLHQKSQRDKLKQQNTQKTEEIKLLKRKVKEMKENLFGSQQADSKKAQLLRKLFELQTLNVKKTPQIVQKKIQKEDFDIYFKNSRMFHIDKSIIIKSKKEKQDEELLNSIEDPELRMLLQSNDNSLNQLKKQLAYLTDD